MTNYRFGEIVLVPFPFTDQSQSKRSPAVVVSSTAYNLARADLVLMAITSQVSAHNRPDEIEIMEWQKAGLLKPSVIKPVFTTIEKDLILRRMGMLETEDQKNLRTILAAVLG